MQRITWNVPISEFHTQSQCIGDDVWMHCDSFRFFFALTPTPASKWFASLRRFTSLASGIKPKSRSCTMAKGKRRVIASDVMWNMSWGLWNMLRRRLCKFMTTNGSESDAKAFFIRSAMITSFDWMFYGCTALIFPEAARLLNSLP